MSETLYIYIALLKNTIISIHPAFLIESVTAGVFYLRRADSSSGSRLDPAVGPFDVVADRPGGPSSAHCQVCFKAAPANSQCHQQCQYLSNTHV